MLDRNTEQPLSQTCVSRWHFSQNQIKMSYEIERKLNEKADKWELHNVQNENRELKSQIHELERKIGYLEGVSQNRYYTLVRLFNLLAENEQFSDLSNQLYELRGSL